MANISRKIDKLNITVGGITSYLCIFLVLNVFIAVLQRYLLESNHIWQSELSLALSSMIFLLCAGYTLYFNSHVRVDIAYERFSRSKRAWVNILGCFVLLFPMCGAIIYFSYEFIVSSWGIFEASPEYSGLYGIFLVKTLIWGFAGFLVAAGISLVINSLKILRSLK